MIVLEMKNKTDFNRLLSHLKQQKIPVVDTVCPEHSQIDHSRIAGVKLLVVVLCSLCLGLVMIWGINAVWSHQVSAKPQNFSGMIGWLPVLFECTILLTSVYFLVRFVRKMTSQTNWNRVGLEPGTFYCMIDLRDEGKIADLLTIFKGHFIPDE